MGAAGQGCQKSWVGPKGPKVEILLYFIFQLGEKVNEKVMESLKDSVNSAASIVVIFGITIITISASILLAVQVGKYFAHRIILCVYFMIYSLLSRGSKYQDCGLLMILCIAVDEH